MPQYQQNRYDLLPSTDKKPCLHESEIHTLSFRGTSFLTHRRHKEYREDGSDSDNNLICRYQGVTVRDIQTTCRTLQPFS